MKLFSIITMTACLFLLVSCNNAKKAQTDMTDNTEVEMRGNTMRLLGNEPFWSVDIDESGIVLNQMDKGETTYPYVDPKVSTSVTIYETSMEMDGRTSNLKIIIEEKDCSDGMSDVMYGYKATVVKDGRTLKGCGEKR